MNFLNVKINMITFANEFHVMKENIQIIINVKISIKHVKNTNQRKMNSWNAMKVIIYPIPNVFPFIQDVKMLYEFKRYK